MNAKEFRKVEATQEVARLFLWWLGDGVKIDDLNPEQWKAIERSRDYLLTQFGKVRESTED